MAHAEDARPRDADERFPCPLCGAVYEPHVNFCGRCGTRLSEPCASCGARNPHHFRHCGSCGAGLTPSAVSNAIRPAERRIVTVLFADVKGFTKATLGMDPELVADLMNRYFDRLSEEIGRFGGTIDKYIGDAIMALFGAPEAHENDPERAILAALAMQRALRDFSLADLSDLTAPLQMRVGIATGEVLFGLIGSAAKRDYTVMGETVNLASRLEGQAPVGGILVSEATFALTETLFEFEETSNLQIKGISDPITAYQVIRKLNKQVRRRGLDDHTSPLVGREAEVKALFAAYQATTTGLPKVVEIVGEAGIGKSRLIDEVVAKAGDNVKVIRGHSLPHEAASTFGLIRDLLRHLLSAGHKDPHRSTRSLPALVADPVDRALVARLLGVEAAPLPPKLTAPEDVNRETVRAVGDFILRAARSTPLICVFEDLHWADGASLAMVRQILSRIDVGPFLFVLVYRPEFEETKGWALPAERIRIDIRPLTAEEAADLLHRLLGQGTLPAEFERAIVKRADGNPYFLEELVRSLADRGAVVREGESWRFVRAMDVASVPPTLRAVLTARIDQLPDAERLLLQQASVVGPSFDIDVLKKLSDAPDNVPVLVKQLRDLDLIRLDESRGQVHRFKQTLCQEVAYNTMSLTLRRATHRRIAAVLEASFQNPNLEQLEELVYHHFRGEEWDRVFEVARRAADRARRLYANREAIVLYQRTLNALDQLERTAGRTPGDLSDTPQPIDFTAERAMVLAAQADLHHLVGDHASADLGYRRALQFERRPMERAAILRKLGEVHERLGEFAAALQFFSNGIEELGPEHEHSAEMARLLSSMSIVLYHQGEIARAADAYRRSLRINDSLTSHRDSTILLNFTPLLGEQETDEQLQRWKTALGKAEGAGDLSARARAHMQLGSLYARRRETTPAIDHLTNAARLLEEHDDQNGAAGALTSLGSVQQSIGDIQGAAQSLQQAIKIRTATGDQRGLARAFARFALLLVDDRRYPHAIRFMERAIQTVETIGARESFPEYHRQLGNILLTAGQFERSAREAEEALRWAVQIGSRYEQAAARHLLGRVYHHQDRIEEARAQLRAAIALFDRVGAMVDSEAAKRDLAATGAAA